MKIAWSKKVSNEFLAKLEYICGMLKIDPSWLMACMAFESGINPQAVNKAGSGAVGLIQFMPQTALTLGTTTGNLLKMSGSEQLNYVYKYFFPLVGKIKSMEDLYMAILWPSGVGKNLDYVLFDKSDTKYPKQYIQNRGLDFNKDGKITKLEACVAVQKKLGEGLKPENCNG